MNLASRHQSEFTRHSVTYFAILIGLCGAGLLLRFNCLGCLGFRWDEDLTALAVRALAETGSPELPSGMIYVRFYPLQWILAASTELLGFSEASLRLPGVISGMLLIPASYWVTSKLFDRRTAIIVAAAVAFSFNQVEMARTARMYAPFFLVFMLAAYSIYAAFYRDRDRVFSPGVLVLAAIALSIHQLAYALAILIVLAIPLNPSLRRVASLLGHAALIGVMFLATKKIEEHLFYRGARIAEADEIGGGGTGGGVLDSILSQVTFPDITLIIELYRHWPAVAVVILIVGFGLVAWTTAPLWRYRSSEAILVTATLVSAIFQQFNLAIIFLVLVLVARGDGLIHARNPAWFRGAAAATIIAMLWVLVLALAVATADPDAAIVSGGPRKLVRQFVDYPNFRLFWSFVLDYPLLAPALFFGTLWTIDGVARRSPDPAALFVGCGFWAILFVNSILRTQYEFLRYNLHIDWLFITLCVIGLLRLPDILQKSGLPLFRLSMWGADRPVYLAAVVILVLAGVNPVAAALTSNRDYREDGAVYRALHLDTYPDFATPSEFVRSRAGPDDRILVFDPREYWNYIGRVDFWIWSRNYEAQTFRKNGKDFDLYLGVPVIHDLDAVRDAIGTGPAWIVYSRDWLSRTPWIDADIKGFVGSLADLTVYTGRDDDTVVIHIPATTAR